MIGIDRRYGHRTSPYLKQFLIAGALAGFVSAAWADDLHLTCAKRGPTGPLDYVKTINFDLDLEKKSVSVQGIQDSGALENSEHYTDGSATQKYNPTDGSYNVIDFVLIDQNEIRIGRYAVGVRGGRSEQEEKEKPTYRVDRRTGALIYLNYLPYDCTKRTIVPRDQLPQKF